MRACLRIYWWMGRVGLDFRLVPSIRFWIYTQQTTHVHTTHVPTCRFVSVLAATNAPEAIDPAFLRPGRFDALVYAPLPNLVSILMLHFFLLVCVSVRVDAFCHWWSDPFQLTNQLKSNRHQ